MKKNKGRTDTLRQWLKEHDLFNLAALCRRIDYDRGALSHWLENHAGWDISDEVVDRLEKALKPYGYK